MAMHGYVIRICFRQGTNSMNMGMKRKSHTTQSAIFDQLNMIK